VKRVSILRYWLKKHKSSLIQDDTYRVKYSKRKKLADKKLRINGKFVSKKQAITQLGMSHKEFTKALKSQTK
jgi:CCT motif